VLEGMPPSLASPIISTRQAAQLNFTLKHWCVWQDQAQPTHDTWPVGEVLPLNGKTPDVSFLPMMQRRRLSPLARAACAVAWQCQQKHGDLPTVFFSNHGESQYYYEILENLAAKQGVSPSRFSLCVHNAVAGLSSLHSASFLPYVALAGGTEGLFAAFLEAAGMLLDVPQVLVVCYEQPLPAAYQAYASSSDMTWALAMVLGRSSEAGYQLKLVRDAGQASNTDKSHPSHLIHAILANQRHGQSQLEQSHWCWSLTDA
jgi:Beta-ketoacyl synthase, N-terminal domain